MAVVITLTGFLSSAATDLLHHLTCFSTSLQLSCFYSAPAFTHKEHTTQRIIICWNFLKNIITQIFRITTAYWTPRFAFMHAYWEKRIRSEEDGEEKMKRKKKLLSQPYHMDSNPRLIVLEWGNTTRSV